MSLAGCSMAERDALVVEMQATRAALVDLAENPATDEASATLAASLERSLGVAEANLPVVTTPEEAVGVVGKILGDADVPFAGMGALVVAGFLGWIRQRNQTKIEVLRADEEETKAKNIVRNISKSRIDGTATSVPGQIVLDEGKLRDLNTATGVNEFVRANK